MIRRNTAKAVVSATLLGMIATLPLAAISSPACAQEPGAEAPPAALPSEAEPPRDWMFQAIPYLWLPEVSGTVGTRGRSVSVDVNFKDVFDLMGDGDLLAGMGHFEALHRSGVALFIDAIGGTARPSHQRAILPPSDLSIDANLKLNFMYLELGVAVRILEGLRGGLRDVVRGAVVPNPPGGRLDLLIGGRITYFYQDIRLAGSRGMFSRSAQATTAWGDPFVGTRFAVPIIDELSFFFRGDVGGSSGGAQLAWNLIGGFEYVLPWRPGDARTSLIAAYKAYDFDYKSDSSPNKTRLDLNQRGPGIGLAFQF